VKNNGKRFIESLLFLELKSQKNRQNVNMSRENRMFENL